MLWIKNKKNRYTPAYPSFTIMKVGYEGVFISRTCFPDELRIFQLSKDRSKRFLLSCVLLYQVGQGLVVYQNDICDLWYSRVRNSERFPVCQSMSLTHIGF